MPIRQVSAKASSVVMTNDASRTVKHADEFMEEFVRNTDVSIGLIIIRTREAYRVAQTIQRSAEEKDIIFKTWQCNTGWQEYNQFSLSNPEIDRSKPTGADGMIQFADALKAVCEETRAGYFVMHGMHHHFDKPIVQQWFKDFVRIAREREIRLIILAPEGAKVDANIEDDVHIMDWKAPSHAELVKCFTDVVESIQEEDLRPHFSQDQVDTIVQNGIGMTWMEFEVAVSLGIIEAQSRLDDRLSEDENAELDYMDFVKVVLRHKTEAVKRTDILEIIPSISMSEVGGLDILKAWVADRQLAYTKEAADYGIDPPKGMLCVGPPGGGKSLISKAVADGLNVPLIKFDISRVFQRYVGDSEQRIRIALKLIESMSPCVLLLDEIDKGFAGMGGGGGDGGTSARVFGTILNWMQERDNRRYPVFIVMTANNVTNLPPELMRKGRVDEIFAVTFPSEKERQEIFNIHLKKRGHQLPLQELRKVAQSTQNYVGAEIEEIVKSSLLKAFGEQLEHPTADILIEEARKVKPLYDVFRDRVTAMNEWARNNAQAASSGMSFEDAGDRTDAQGTQVSKPGARKVVMPSGKKPIKPRPDAQF